MFSAVENPSNEVTDYRGLSGDFYRVFIKFLYTGEFDLSKIDEDARETILDELCSEHERGFFQLSRSFENILLYELGQHGRQVELTSELEYEQESEEYEPDSEEYEPESEEYEQESEEYEKKDDYEELEEKKDELLPTEELNEKRQAKHPERHREWISHLRKREEKDELKKELKNIRLHELLTEIRMLERHVETNKHVQEAREGIGYTNDQERKRQDIEYYESLKHDVAQDIGLDRKKLELELLIKKLENEYSNMSLEDLKQEKERLLKRGRK
jgi:hypothetical protein